MIYQKHKFLLYIVKIKEKETKILKYYYYEKFINVKKKNWLFYLWMSHWRNKTIFWYCKFSFIVNKDARMRKIAIKKLFIFQSIPSTKKPRKKLSPSSHISIYIIVFLNPEQLDHGSAPIHPLPRRHAAS